MKYFNLTAPENSNQLKIMNEYCYWTNFLEILAILKMPLKPTWIITFHKSMFHHLFDNICQKFCLYCNIRNLVSYYSFVFRVTNNFQRDKIPCVFAYFNKLCFYGFSAKTKIHMIFEMNLNARVLIISRKNFYCTINIDSTKLAKNRFLIS